MRTKHVIISLILFSCFLINYSQSPVNKHGLLTVDGNKISDKNGMWVSFAGMSFYWSNNGWGGNKYYNSNVVSWLKEDWDVKIIRAAIGVEGSGGYLVDSASNMNRAITLIEAAIEEGIYVLVDWHSHSPDYVNQAVAFFKEIATRYGSYDNIIYEIFNEPLQVSWVSVIKPYAENVISAIRAIDPDNMIVVGTPTWSQDVDDVIANPITVYPNIAYVLHFYAGTHKSSIRSKAITALNNGIPVMVTEWGTVESDGDGDVDVASTNEWMSFCKSRGITQLNWVVNDKEEGASALVSGASISGGWSESDLTESGKFVKSIIENWGTGFIYPEIEIIKTDITDGRIINIEFTKEINNTTIDKSDFGFFAGSSGITIDSVVTASSDPKDLVLYLNSPVVYSDDSLTLTFTKGNMASTDGLVVQSFTEQVFNMLPGSNPAVINAYTDTSLNLVYVRFTKKMESPAAYTDSFNIYINSNPASAISGTGNIETDSSVIYVEPADIILNSDTVLISFSGTGFASKDGGALHTFDSVPVINNEAKNPEVIEVYTGVLGQFIYVKYSENMNDTSLHEEDFQVLVNDTLRSVINVETHITNKKLVILTPASVIYAEDTCIIRIVANGPLSASNKPAIEFGPDTIINNVVPTVTIPGLIEAEDFIVNVGFQTEETTDAGGGQNLGYTDAGDYLEYSILVPYDGAFTVYYRVSALSVEGMIQLSIDGVVKDTAYVPVTGGWQIWETICGCMDLEEGVRTMRITALTELFNMNWYSFEDGCNTQDSCHIDPKPAVKVETPENEQFTLSPNPAVDIIELTGEYEVLNTITVIDLNGKIIFSEQLNNNKTIDISKLEPGFYFVKLVYNNNRVKNFKLIKEQD